MRVLDPGHRYMATAYDAAIPMEVQVQFMKRDFVSHPGGHYPGNQGSYPGTNMQELLRVLIDRTKYLNAQIPCDENEWILVNLRGSLYMLEQRAHNRRGWKLDIANIDQIEDIPTCAKCGHIFCGEHTIAEVKK